MAAAIVGGQPDDVRPDRRRLDLRVVLGGPLDHLAAARRVVQLSGGFDHQFSDSALVRVRHMLVVSRALPPVGSGGRQSDGAGSCPDVSDVGARDFWRGRRAARTSGRLGDRWHRARTPAPAHRWSVRRRRRQTRTSRASFTAPRRRPQGVRTRRWSRPQCRSGLAERKRRSAQTRVLPAFPSTSSDKLVDLFRFKPLRACYLRHCKHRGACNSRRSCKSRDPASPSDSSNDSPATAPGPGDEQGTPDRMRRPCFPLVEALAVRVGETRDLARGAGRRSGLVGGAEVGLHGGRCPASE